MLLVVWIAVAVLALLVLGGLAYVVLGAAARLRREVAGFSRELAPVLEQAAATAARAGQAGERPANER